MNILNYYVDKILKITYATYFQKIKLFIKAAYIFNQTENILFLKSNIIILLFILTKFDNFLKANLNS